MTCTIFDYIDLHKRNHFKEWSMKLQKPQLAKLNQKIDMLELHGLGLLPETLTNSDVPGILKLRVKGNVQLRPLLCKGPGSESEFTFLVGAKEIQLKLVPRDILAKAQEFKDELAKDVTNRRVKHERVKK